MLRYMPLIVIALLIDALQMIVDIAIFVVFTVAPGTIAGAAGGGALCGKACAVAGGAAGAVADLIPFTHGILTNVSEPIGIALGFGLNICLSLTFGAGLILLLILFRMFYPMYVFGGSIFELLPGFDILPGWTAMVVSCIMRKKREEARLTGVVTIAKAAYKTIRIMEDTRTQVRKENQERYRAKVDGIQAKEPVYAA
jgi:hypothetical protein